MKTLSFHQPWAELILQGRKTIDLRTWRTHYRGRIAIHAGQKANHEACIAYGLNADRLPRGALVGTVEIVDIEPLDQEGFERLREQHLAVKDYPEYPAALFGWRLAGAQRLPAPVPMPGRRQLYDTPDELLAGALPRAGASSPAPLPDLVPESKAAPAADGEGSGYDPARPFELRVVPRRGQEYGLTVYQWAAPGNGGGGTNSAPRAERLVEIAGDPLRAVIDQVLEALRRAGYRVTELSRERRQPFRLSEESGLRLGLLFLAAKPLTRIDRIEAIASGLRTMPSEEAYYWFSKCTAAATAANAQRALRILLAGE